MKLKIGNIFVPRYLVDFLNLMTLVYSLASFITIFPHTGSILRVFNSWNIPAIFALTGENLPAEPHA